MSKLSKTEKKKLRTKSNLEYLKGLIPLVESGEVEIESLDYYVYPHPSGIMTIDSDNKKRVKIKFKFLD